MRDISSFLNLLTHVKQAGTNQWTADCPCQTHKTPAKHLSIGIQDDRILVKCFGNHTTEDIASALKLEMSDLFIKETTLSQPKTIVATYDYNDENNNLLFQVVRYEPKDFVQRHKNGTGEWVWNMEGIRRVLYHLPEIMVATDETIYLVEGEKDADTLWKWGQVATTSPGGAHAWKPEYADYLTGKKVVIIPDKDPDGFAYAKQAARSLQNKVTSIKCLILPGEAKDISAWIETGGDVETLSALEQDIAILFNAGKPNYQQENEDTISWHKSIEGQTLSFRAESLRQERTGLHARISIALDYQPLAWSLFNIERSEDRVRLANSAHAKLHGDIKTKFSKDDLHQDLDLFCAGLWDFQLQSFIPELMVGEEIQEPPQFYLFPYIIVGGGSILFAPPGKGKSNSALVWAQSINCGISKLFKVEKTPVLYINLERSGQSLRRRLANVNRVLGLPANQTLLAFNARGKSLSNIAPAIRKAVKQYGVKLIILDSISRAGFGKLTEDTPVNNIIDMLSGLCETWLALGHTPRASEEHLFGSIMADAGADIIIQLRSQANENTLGIGYEITKSNDLPQFNQKIYAFEFEEWQLKSVRPAKPFEFPDIEAKAKTNMLDAVIEFISNQDTGDATATELETALGFNRVNVSKLLNGSGKFKKTKKVKHSQYFGVLEKEV